MNISIYDDWVDTFKSKLECVTHEGYLVCAIIIHEIVIVSKLIYFYYIWVQSYYLWVINIVIIKFLWWACFQVANNYIVEILWLTFVINCGNSVRIECVLNLAVLYYDIWQLVWYIEYSLIIIISTAKSKTSKNKWILIWVLNAFYIDCAIIIRTRIIRIYCC